MAGQTGGVSGIHLHFEILSKAQVQINPRQSLAEAFPEFTPIVDAEGLKGPLDGDKHDNTLIGNDAENYMEGLDGFDAYEVGFGDTITDDDGRILIGNKVLSGNAFPKKNPDGTIVDGQWMLDGYDLVRDVNNLLIKQAGSTSGKKITINDYPFDTDVRAFGITLGKAVEDQYDSTLIHNLDLVGGPILPTADKRGSFLMSTSGPNSRLRKFDSREIKFLICLWLLEITIQEIFMFSLHPRH